MNKLNFIFFKNGVFAIILATIIFALTSCGETESKTTPNVFKKIEPDTTAVVIPEKVEKLILNENMVFVKGGTFIMGCTDEQGEDCAANEKPVHEVELPDFYISKYEMTQEGWEAVMGSNPSKFKDCPTCPVESVNWDDVNDFLEKLNAQTGKKYRLLTEAEREYAARGGQESKRYKYAGSNDAESVAWYAENASLKTHPVGMKGANELGLYDMSGNVWEWCSDWYGVNYYEQDESNSITVYPIGIKKGFARVNRGGSWANSMKVCRVSVRNYWTIGRRYGHLGFRLAHSAK